MANVVCYYGKMKLKDRVRQSLAKRSNRVVLRRELSHFGSPTQLSQVLLDLQKDGMLDRIGEGVYAKPSLRPLSSTTEIHDLALEALRKLGIPVVQSAVKEREIVAYVPSNSRRSRHLVINGIPVHIKSPNSFNRIDSSECIKDLPTRHVAEYVHRLAAAHHVTYQRSRLEDWAEAVTRAAGDNVRTDRTDGLLIRLKQRKILNAEQFSRLLINHRRESMNV